MAFPSPTHCPECAASGVAVPQQPCRHDPTFNLPAGSIVRDTDCECILCLTEDKPYQVHDPKKAAWYRSAEIVSLCDKRNLHGKFKRQGLIDGYPARRLRPIDPLVAEFIAIDLKGANATKANSADRADERASPGPADGDNPSG